MPWYLWVGSGLGAMLAFSAVSVNGLFEGR